MLNIKSAIVFPFYLFLFTFIAIAWLIFKGIPSIYTYSKAPKHKRGFKPDRTLEVVMREMNISLIKGSQL